MVRPITILVVEDSVFLNHAVSTMLKEKCPVPCRTYQAFTLQEAHRILNSSRIDYLILDLALPDGDGEEVFAFIRDRNLTKVIVLTAQKQQAKRRESLFKEGVLDYFSKENPLPYLCREILQLIQRIQSNAARTVLIIDDTAGEYACVQETFTNRRYRVQTAEGAEQAFSFLSQALPDLILLNIEMPNRRGDAILRRLKESEEWITIPVIVMTASTDEEAKLEMMKHGAQSVLGRPLSLEVMIAKSEHAIAVKESQDRLKKLSKSLQNEVSKMALELREKQEVINNQMRQVAMGEMFSAITHQWMQPLSMIGLTCEDLAQKGHESPLQPSELDEFESKIDHYIGYMKEVAEHFKNFFKPMQIPAPFSIIGSVRDILMLLETRYRNISITIDGDEAIEAEGFKNEFQQVIINLLDNARDSMEEGYAPAQIDIALRIAENRPRLTVRDNGRGIDSRVLQNLFSSYTTTKKGGNGIGLYLSRKILAKIGASITGYNTTKGAEFAVTF